MVGVSPVESIPPEDRRPGCKNIYGIVDGITSHDSPKIPRIRDNDHDKQVWCNLLDQFTVCLWQLWVVCHVKRGLTAIYMCDTVLVNKQEYPL